MWLLLSLNKMSMQKMYLDILNRTDYFILLLCECSHFKLWNEVK